MRRGRRNRRCYASVTLACLAVLCALPPTARGAIRVVEDEVYFTIRAPGAKEVYLVGDFNNWNATVEKMERFGDTFEISLYMVEGSYRYKFIVDGDWIVDPDNPGNPKRGSPLVLVEKPAGLMLLTEDPEEPAAEPVLRPTFRYIGQFRWNQPEDASFDDNHIFDLDFVVKREKVRGRALLKSTSDVWEASDNSFEVTMNRGYVGTDFSGIRLDAFENDGVVWTSLDPVKLVGDLGVFDYNAGYSRKGVSLDYKFSDPLHVRGLYADHTGPLRPQASYPLSDLAGATAGTDTTVYAFENGVGDSDVLGFEFYIDAHDFQAGVVSRANKGRRPGVMADVSLAAAGSTAVVRDTREDSDGTEYWIRLKKFYGVGAWFGYGRGHSEIHQLTRELQPVFDDTDSLETTQRAESLEESLRFETSNRFFAGLDHKTDHTTLSLGWDRVTFEFDGLVYGGAEATVDRAVLRFDWKPPDWEVDARLEYTDQDYGKTPPALLVDSPARNMWLDWRDNFTVPNIVGIDTRSYADLAASATWYPGLTGGEEEVGGAPPSWHPARTPPYVRLEAGTTTSGFFDELEYTRARLTAVWIYRERYFAMADGRVAAYDKPSWGPKETFLSGYVEVGYQYRWFNVNLGWGFDPVIFDPVINDYNDIGRLEVLRRSVAGGVLRGQSAEVGKKLLSLERDLQNVQTIKLEVMILF
jgi:hypothetical protein